MKTITQSEDTEHQFGRLLLHDRINAKKVAIWCLISGPVAILLGFTLFLAVYGEKGSSQPGPLIGGVIVGVLCLTAGAALLAKGNREIWFYERGVVFHSREGKQIVPYDTVASMQYCMAIGHNYRAMSFGLRMLKSPTDTVEPEISWATANVRPGDTAPNWENGAIIKELIQKPIAERIFQKVSDGAEVRWTPEMVLTPRGIRFVASGKEVPWASIESAELNSGSGKIEVMAEGKRMVNVVHHEWNAWPGLLVVAAFRQRVG